MGFGYGRTTHWNDSATDLSGARVAKVHLESMVAHIWNAQSQSFARTGSGNFAFRGTEIYSYGQGWIVGKIFADIALINGKRVSVTTSGHESSAWRASQNRTRFSVPELTAVFAHWLDRLAGYDKAERKAAVRRFLEDSSNLELLKSRAIAPGAYRYDGTDESEELGAWLASYAGLRAAVWPNAKAKAERAAAKAEETRAREERKRFVASAIAAADMPEKAFRNMISLRDSSGYDSHIFTQSAKRYRRFRLKAGLSDARRKRLLARERRIREVLADYSRLHAIAHRRTRVASLIHFVRQIPESFGTLVERDTAATSNQLRLIAGNMAELGGFDCVPSSARGKLRDWAEALKPIADEKAEAERIAAEEERERRREEMRLEHAEREERQRVGREQWLSGERSSTSGLAQFQREDGTPYLRVYGGALETSWGASVPLEHAVKVFRFVKLCKESGRDWHRNGKTIRVGHFQVDSIAANGDFVAGCHRFTWQEVERVAALVGLADAAASDAALEESN